MANLKMTKNKTPFLCHERIHGCPGPCSLPNPLLPHSPHPTKSILLTVLWGHHSILVSRCLSNPLLQLCFSYCSLSAVPDTLGLFPGSEGVCSPVSWVMAIICAEEVFVWVVLSPVQHCPILSLLTHSVLVSYCAGLWGMVSWKPRLSASEECTQIEARVSAVAQRHAQFCVSVNRAF